MIPQPHRSAAILIRYFIVSKIAARFVRRILVTIGADKLAERLNEIRNRFIKQYQVVPSMLLSKGDLLLLLFSSL